MSVAATRTESCQSLTDCPNASTKMAVAGTWSAPLTGTRQRQHTNSPACFVDTAREA